MGFGMWLLAILLPPVYFIVRGKWVAATLNGIIWLISFPLMLVVVGFFTWILCVAHAGWDLAQAKQDEMMKKQATFLAQQMRDEDE